MSDTKDTGGNTGGRKPLTVARKSSGTVKQSFSHGRSKQVVVETKKRRSVGPSGSAAAPGGDASKAASDSLEARLVATAKKLGITVNELKARQKALYERKQEEASRAKEEQTQKAAQDRLRSEQEKKIQEVKEREEAEARRKAEEEARKVEEAAAKERADRAPKARGKTDAAAPAATPPVDDSPARAKRGKSGRDDRDRASRDSQNRGSRGGGGGGERRRGKLTISSALGDDADRQRSLASLRRARERERERRTGGNDQREKMSVEVTLPETITLQDLASVTL